MSGARPFNSPCVDVCSIDDDTGWCIGCGRTMNEIATWATMGDEARKKVLREVDIRKADIPNREHRAKRLRRSPY
ncbi:MAG: DUF1289 domain-containing protein [Alphaproteobacteria bacterium]|nr:DUF1289 domain-containing protein [Alphaproteobacteria bacterium]